LASSESYLGPTPGGPTAGPQALGVKVWNVQTGQELFTLKGHSSVVFSVAFSPDGKRLVTGAGIGGGGQGGEVKVWDVQTRQELPTLDGICGLSNGVAFNPDGRRLVGRGRDRTVKIWDATPLPEKP